MQKEEDERKKEDVYSGDDDYNDGPQGLSLSASSQIYYNVWLFF